MLFIAADPNIVAPYATACIAVILDCGNFAGTSVPAETSALANEN
jgi:preprotein translocase subunit SecB